MQTPWCPHLESCGGCSWPEDRIEIARADKKDRLELTLNSIFRRPPPTEYDFAKTSQYRCRTIVRIRAQEHQRLQVGYFASGSRELVAVRNCPVLEPVLDTVLSKLAATSLPASGRWTLEMRSLADSNQVALCLLAEQGDGEELLTLLRSFPEVIHVSRRGTAESQKLFLDEKVGGLEYYTGSLSFKQSHRTLNHVLRALVLEAATSLKLGKLVELYAGSANLSLPLAQAGSHVCAVESDSAAVACARHTLSKNALESRVQFSQQSAESFVTQTERAFWRGVKAVLADPPRAGLGPLAEVIAKLAVPNVLLVHCTRKGLEADLKVFATNGYKAKRVVGLDFFPQTDQLEVFTHLYL